MTRWYTENPLKVCGEQHSNVTIGYHECLCQFNYLSQKRRMGLLKFKHCAVADEMRKQMDFDMYKIIGFSCLVFIVVAIVLFCSFKWYQQTNTNPCDGFCSCLYPCKKKKKRRRVVNAVSNGQIGNGGQDVHDTNDGFDENWVHDMNADVGSFQHTTLNGTSNGHTVVAEDYHNRQKKRQKKTPCMLFCLSEPVQDCCEFLDCDIMWRKKNVYSQPYFGRNKKCQNGELNNAYGMKSAAPPSGESENGTLQRRPTRPAPPPPQLPGAPGSSQHDVPVFDDGTQILDDIVCEPIPEAPPSPEPVRVQQPDQPRSIYVDPLAFLQRPFLRLSIALSGKDSNKLDAKADPGKDEDEPDALYSRVKDFVMSKVRKAGSVVSLNRAGEASGVGISSNPDGSSQAKSQGKYGKTGSLASLHDITEAALEKTYGGSKRSMSLASLHMMDNTLQSTVGASGNPSRNHSVHASRHDIADEDVSPNQRDEYIDLEEMARKMAARMQQQNAQTSQYHETSSESNHSPATAATPVVVSQPLSVQALQQHQSIGQHSSIMRYPSSQASPTDRTPDFIPASAYVANPSENKPQDASYEIGPSVLYPNASQQQQSVQTVSGSFTAPHQQQMPQTSGAFSQSNFTSFQEQPTTHLPAEARSTVTKPAVPARPHNITVPASSPSPNMLSSLVPYAGPSIKSVPSTPNSTLGHAAGKPSVPPRPTVLSENPNYKSLTRPSIGPPSPKVQADSRKNQSYSGGVPGASIPRSPIITGKPTIATPIPLSLHEQQILQQQLLQQQQLQQMYMQPHMSPAVQQLLLQQQLQEQHTIMTPAVQQQMLQEQQMYQQLLQHQQHYQLQQQYQQHLQQQLIQQQFQHGMRYRQPLSSTSSTGSSASSRSTRSIHKPNHPPPPPPSSQPQPNVNNLAGAPIESSI